jgi:DNA-binding MarR family transcriptional regulator
LSLPLGTTFAIMARLEEKGLVRISHDAIQSNRIVAITAKGRQELKR